MQEAEKVSSLIGDIYDAALDPSLWPSVLGKARDFSRGTAAALYSKDASAQTGDVYYHDGVIDPYYRRLYFAEYVKLDPAATGHFLAEIDEPLATGDLVDYGEFLQSRFYKEWAQPQGLVDSVVAVLDKSTTSAALFGVFRSARDGIADAEMRRRMRLIVPHLRRAVAIGRVVEHKTAEAASFAATLDGLSAAMFLVNANARIVHANAAGHRMLQAGDPLRAIDGRLAADRADTDNALRDIFTACGCGDAAVGTLGIAVPLLAHDGQRYVTHILPLTSGARRRAGANYAAVAALFVCKATQEIPSAPEAIARTFDLTPSELRVLLAVVEVGGVPEIAGALGVAETTVKTHLRRLYTKTGASRQAELVKLLAGFANPLMN